MPYRSERPYKRTLASGRKVWVARFTDRDGHVRYAKPSWNGASASFKLKADAQRAINEAYDQPLGRDTVGEYAKTWTRRHPRSQRSNATADHRLSRVLGVFVGGRRLREWPLSELRRKHAGELVEHLLVDDGRAREGAAGIMRVLSAMLEDAIEDELIDANPFRGVKIRSNDPRIAKAPREPRVFSFELMRAFAAGGRPEARQLVRDAMSEAERRKTRWSPKHDYEAMLLVFATTGLRLGEVLGLLRRDFDGEAFHVRGTAHGGRFTEGNSEKKLHVRTVPCSPSTAAAIEARPVRIDTMVLFPTPGGSIFNESNFRRDVWLPARAASGVEASPHDMRHSWISHLRAAGVDDADLAKMAGHRVETMLGVYTHALEQSAERVREVIG